MKITRVGKLSIHDSSPWEVGVWREVPEAVDGELCAPGLHSIKGNDPLISTAFCWPCEVWEDECEGLLAENSTKARYRRQRIVKEITDQFPIVVKVNEFIRSLPSIKLMDGHGTPEPWMVVEDMTLAEVQDAARGVAQRAAQGAARYVARYAVQDAARSVAQRAARSVAQRAAQDAAQYVAQGVARSVARYAAQDAAQGAARYVARYAVQDAAQDAAWYAAQDAAQDAAWYAANAAGGMALAAGGMALAILVSDLDVDTTQLTRWWKVWELGYHPISAEGDKLICARIILSDKDKQPESPTDTKG